MNENEMNGFLSAMGQEFSRALQSVSGDEMLCGADVYSVVTRILPAHLLSPKSLADLRPDQIENLRSGFAKFLEVADADVTRGQITTAMANTLARWPAAKPGDGNSQ